MELTLFNENEKQDDSIFKMFYPNDNDNFTDMSDRDIYEFLMSLENYRMFYRDKLDINSKNTFGTEIECVDANIIKIAQLFRESDLCNDWKYKDDLSLDGDRQFVSINGRKYVIQPKEYITDVLNNNKWDELYEGCSIISSNASLNGSCGGHVHVGSQILGRKKQNWLDFFLLWSAYEDVAYRFSSGLDENFRKNGERYAFPVSNIWRKKLKNVTSNANFDRIIEIFGCCQKIHSVNLEHVDKYNVCGIDYGNTVEFRLFNGCYDPIVIQNNINFVVHLMEYATSNDFDYVKTQLRKEELDDNYNSTNPTNRVILYNNIDLFKSLELADMIFSNNLDKINFLKQCVKSIDCVERCDDVKKLVR